MNLWLFACICLAIIKSSQHDKNENLFQLPINVYEEYYKLRINTLLQEDNFEHNSEVEIRYKECVTEKATYFRMARLTVEQMVEKCIVWQNWQEIVYPKISNVLEKIFMKDGIEKGDKNGGKEGDGGGKNDGKGVYYASKNGGGGGGSYGDAPGPVGPGGRRQTGGKKWAGIKKKMIKLLEMLNMKDIVGRLSQDERMVKQLLQMLLMREKWWECTLGVPEGDGGGEGGVGWGAGVGGGDGK